MTKAVVGGDRHRVGATGAAVDEPTLRETVGLVRSVLYRAFGPHEDMEDLVQDVFVGLIRTLPGLRDRGALRGFVVGAALHVGRTALRRQRTRRWVALTATGELPETKHTGTNHEARRAVVRLGELLDTVDDRSRKAFVLRHVAGLELSEVAASLGCSLATTKRSLARMQKRVNAWAKQDACLTEYA
jgi:RNA polymerase sigma-70 factor, ECF subfamily